jgi:sterol desaturase/sphingolipid hydroxylase (fatty acid hydroxylase superfamily)
MFGPEWMERLSHVHPLVPLSVWGPVSILTLAASFRIASLGVGQIFLWIVAGLLVWTLVEYALHRYVFHWRPQFLGGERLHFILHGVHHEDPSDPTRLVMPLAGSVTLAAILIPLFWLVLGPDAVFPYLTGFLWGYLAYDYTHYALHHFKPRTAWGRMLKDHHMKHHFVEHESRWGVSSPLWDYVFRTTGKARAETRV